MMEGYRFSDPDPFASSFYRKLEEGSNMSVDSNLVAGSNSTRTGILYPAPDFSNPSAGHSIFRPAGRVSHALTDDALAQALTDPRYPAESLKDYHEWTIDLYKLTMGTAFAQGTFGKLYSGTYSGEDVAIKLLERPDKNPEGARLMEQQVAQEVMMLATLKHSNVVRFIGVCRKPMVWCIVTEYAKRGLVRQFLTRRPHNMMAVLKLVRQFLTRRPHNRTTVLKLAVTQALDVARGMAYVHGLGFIHRDLKSDNLLIMADKSIKIAHLGVARIEMQTEGMTPWMGTYRWMAPEMIQHRPYNQKVDVYSFGIVLWELITGMLPFQNMTAVQAAFAVVNQGARPVIPHDCLPALSEIMTRCWDANPDVRPPFSQVVRMLEYVESEVALLSHKWFECSSMSNRRLRTTYRGYASNGASRCQ